jgi:hypothetical protein
MPQAGNLRHSNISPACFEAAGKKGKTTVSSVPQVKNDRHKVFASPTQEISTRELWAILRSQVKTLDHRFRHGRVAVTRADLARLTASLDALLTVEASEGRDA